MKEPAPAGMMDAVRRLTPDALRIPTRNALRLWRSMFRLSMPRVYQTSIPKSGTHLLAKALNEMGFALGAHQPFQSPHPLLDYDLARLRSHALDLHPGEYVVEHLGWKQEAEETLRASGIKVLFMYRDPRASAVSFAHLGSHLNEAHPLYDYFGALPGLRERLAATLEGVGGENSRDGRGRCGWGDLYDAFLPWKHSPDVCCVSYEELVGSRGGGSREAQMAALERIIRFLGLNEKKIDVTELAARVFDESAPTFRKGSVDSWRELDAGMVELLNAQLMRQVREWGYA